MQFKDRNTGDFLRLRVPDNKKTKEWYEFQAKRLIPSATSLVIEDYNEMMKLYKFANNDLSDFDSEIQHYCGNLEEYGATKEKLVPYNPVPAKVEVLKGELLSMGNTHRIILLTAQAHRNKDKELLNLIMASVDEELRLELEKVKAEMQGMPPEEADKYVESLRTEISPRDIDVKKFVSEAEIIFNKLLLYTYHEENVQSKKLETFEDIIKVDRMFAYTGWQQGKPFIKLLNPLHVGFNKNPNTPYVQHGDYVFYREEITLVDALQEYGNKLSDEDIKLLYNYGHNGVNPITKAHVEKPVFDKTRWYSLLQREFGNSYNDKGIGMHQGNGQNAINWTASLFRTHLEFKAFKQVIFFSYVDDEGHPVTQMLSKNADVIPEDAGAVKFVNKFGEDSEKYVWADEEGREFEAEILWVPRRYEVTRLGESVYVDYREVPFQPDNLENPYTKFELSYKGGIVNSRNARFLSLMQRALPYAFQYMAIENLKDREIADYVGHEKVIDVTQIPDELADSNLDGMDHKSLQQDKVLNNEIIARKTKMRLVDSTQTSNGLPPPPTRGAGVMHQVIDTSPGLMNLDALASQVNVKCGLAMGVGPQREGMTIPGSNVSDNRQNLMQFSLSTQTYFYYHDKVWQHILNEHLYNMKTYVQQIFKDGKAREHVMQYVLPNGSIEALKIHPHQLEKLEDIGLYVYNTGKDKMYFDIMLSNMQPLMQNMGEDIEAISAALKSLVSSNSVEEVHKEIQMLSKRTQERMQQMEQAKQEAMEQQKQAQFEVMKYQAELKLVNDLKYLEAEMDMRKTLAAIEVDKYRLENDVNRDNKDDDLAIKQLELQHEREENAKNREKDLEIARINAAKRKA